jgi:hypothetical protein
VRSPQEAETALNIMQRGVGGIVLKPRSEADIWEVARLLQAAAASIPLVDAEIIDIRQGGVGYRVFVDTICYMDQTQGALVGNTTHGYFLVLSGSIDNPYTGKKKRPGPLALDWNTAVYQSRIADAGKMQRFEACSPNVEEVAQYRGYSLSAVDGCRRPRALVLGMTPELRCMAAESGFELFSVDRNPDAIAIFRDWLPEPARSREMIIQDKWAALGEHLSGDVDVILGDGVFGNVLDMGSHFSLLKAFGNLLTPAGAIILRQAVIPRGFPMQQYDAAGLLEKYRAGQLSDAEFGAAMRLWGVSRLAYDPDTCLLDNRIVFEQLDAMAQSGLVTAAELAVVRRCYFAGRNMILPQDLWEEMLTSSGLDFEVRPLTGKDWYRYYPVYCCRLTV